MKKYIIIISMLVSAQVNAQLTVNTINGNVGVKNASPTTPLSVNGTSTLNGNTNLENSGTRYLNFINNFSFDLDPQIDFNGFSWETPAQASPTEFYQVYNYADDRMYFDNDLSLANGVAMTIMNEGNVGINSSDPLNTFQVNGDALINSSQGELKVGFPISSGWGFSTIGGGASLQIRSYTNTSEETGGVTRLRVNNTGVVEVFGDIETSGEYLGLSDGRIKENVESINKGLSKIMAMNPVSYNYKVSEYPELNLIEGNQYGLIAQELESILPGLVSEKGKTININKEEAKIKSVNYIEVIPFLISAIQELNDELNEKNKTISKNSEAYDALVSRLDSLEAMMASNNKLENSTKLD